MRPLLQNLYIKKKYNIDLKHADKDYKIKQKWEGLIQHIAFVIHKNTDITENSNVLRSPLINNPK